MQQRELGAGEHQLIVVYVTDDTADMANLFTIYGAVAEDAALRAKSGWRMVTTTAMPLRHAGTALGGLLGSGYATQIGVTVVYAEA